MRKFLLILFTVLSIYSWGQDKENSSEFQKEISALKFQINNLRIENSRLNDKISGLEKKTSTVTGQVDSLQSNVKENAQRIKNTNEALGIKIQETNKNSNVKFAALDDSISKKSLYWIIAFLAIALIITVVYFLLGRKIKSDKTQVERQIAHTKKAMEEETVKLDTKLTELLESQLKLVEAEKTNSAPKLSEDVDHSLALKVADEIVRINKNLSNMDSGTKGIKQLTASVKRIEDNFAANGYEMPELLNKPFNSGMKMIVTNSVQDENLNAGQEIITRIIKPQVNYKGIMIQAAQVEVSVGQN